MDARGRNRAAWTAVLSGSEDGQSWREFGRASGINAPGEQITPSPTPVALVAPSRNRFYHVDFGGTDSTVWHVGGLACFNHGRRLGIGGPYAFTSAWKSASPHLRIRASRAPIRPP